MLYAGTQHGVYFSYNDGDTWHSLSLNLPDVQISDLWVEDTDLAIATHGRSFYILDDIGPLRQFGAAVVAANDVFLFAPEDAIRSYRGAAIRYWVKKPVQNLTIEILDPNPARWSDRLPASTRSAQGGAAGPLAGGPAEAGAVEVAAAAAGAWRRRRRARWTLACRPSPGICATRPRRRSRR